MTGFGRVEKSLGEIDIAVDIRTLNSRYFDLRSRLGKELLPLEAELKKEVQRRLKRGRVDLLIEVSNRLGERLELDEGLVTNYLALADKLRGSGVKGEVSLYEILNLPGVCVSKTDGIPAEVLSEGVVGAVREALDQVLENRRAEGNALRSELEERVSRLNGYVDSIAGHAGSISDHYQEKLSARVEELLQDCELDEVRLVQEVFYYAEKSDIAEELTRLRCHFDRFAEYLVEAEKVPVGKPLDFLCQEMNREINTILSKASVVEISPGSD